MTIHEALECFLVQLAADGRSEHTIGQYRRHISTLSAWARDVRPRRDRVADLDHEAIARFLAACFPGKRCIGVEPSAKPFPWSAASPKQVLQGEANGGLAALSLAMPRVWLSLG